MSLLETVATIRSFLPEHLQSPAIGIVCGSGLSGLVDTLKNVVIVPYAKIPGFAESTGSSSSCSSNLPNTLHLVPGHKSSFAFGVVGNGIPVCAMLGRAGEHPTQTVSRC